MFNANEFTWEQRGRIDFIIGTLFSNCPAETLFERNQWEEGWQAAWFQEQKRVLRVSAAPVRALSARLQEP
jgi:ribosome modulation factor